MASWRGQWDSPCWSSATGGGSGAGSGRVALLLGRQLVGTHGGTLPGIGRQQGTALDGSLGVGHCAQGGRGHGRISAGGLVSSRAIAGHGGDGGVANFGSSASSGGEVWAVVEPCLQGRAGRLCHRCCHWCCSDRAAVSPLGGLASTRLRLARRRLATADRGGATAGPGAVLDAAPLRGPGQRPCARREAPTHADWGHASTRTHRPLRLPVGLAAVRRLDTLAGCLDADIAGARFSSMLCRFDGGKRCKGILCRSDSGKRAERFMAGDAVPTQRLAAGLCDGGLLAGHLGRERALGGRRLLQQPAARGRGSSLQDAAAPSLQDRGGAGQRHCSGGGGQRRTALGGPAKDRRHASSANWSAAAAAATAATEAPALRCKREEPPLAQCRRFRCPCRRRRPLAGLDGQPSGGCREVLTAEGTGRHIPWERRLDV
mmetsp:Transcript_129707/g.416053  ORF Transcript_129707/g.416053 Transcript_129707/m.416053 type:complete len:431 (-) Transcript_129707:175-1467(-)